MSTTDPTIAKLGDAHPVPISKLRLDPYNPRLPKSLQGESQEDLAVNLEMGFDAFTVAESIAAHGFFASEPLIVIPNDQEEGTWIVVEGNRRLTALLGLTHPEIRKQFAEADRWEPLVDQSAVSADDSVPVVVAKDRDVVIPIVGYRHISGILQWQPYAQATYVAALVDKGMNYAEVAELIGIERKKVADLYRDQAIVAEAQELELPTGNIEKAFSLLSVAMSSPKLRDHIGAPSGPRFTPGTDPVPESKVDELGELIGWIFGTGESEPVITESRQISALGNVVGNPVGLEALRQGETLESAKQKIADTGMDPKERLSKRLTTSKNALLAAAEDFPDLSGDQDIINMVDEVADALAALQSVEE